MRRCFPSADDASYFNTGSRFRLGPRMGHNHDRTTDRAYRVPAFFVRVRVGPVCHERVVEHELRRLKAQAMLLRVEAVLVFVPCPANDPTLCNYIPIATL